MANFYAIYPVGNGGGGSMAGITSINGDTTAAQTIVGGTGISVATAGGTTTITNTGSGTGTVTSVSVVTANGVSGSVATATTTPAITLTLGAITPSSVAAVGTVTGSNLSGTNTGDQTITLTGNVTGSGTGSFATTIANLAVTNAMIANGTINLTTKVTGILPIANGGTNSSAALANNRIMQSLGGAIVEAAAITASRALESDVNGIPVASITTAAELAFVNGVTSAIQTQLNNKQATGNYITALTGDVTATGPGSVAATIANLAVTNAKIANATIDLTTKVTGALPIGNGGTGQVTASAAFGALSPLTTKGDILTYSTLNARLPVGTDGQVLVADSAQALGIKWDSVTATIPNVTQGAAGLVASAGQLLGTNTNDSASAGNVGERISSFVPFASAVSVTSTQDVTSISLTAGDWEVSFIGLLRGLVTGLSDYKMSISLTSATDGTIGNNALQGNLPVPGTYTSFGSMSERISVAATTTVYLVMTQNGAGSMDGWGRLSARRMR